MLSPAKVREITRKIESGRLKPSMQTNRDHVNHLKKKANDTSCPKCGSKMILREAKKGLTKVISFGDVQLSKM